MKVEPFIFIFPAIFVYKRLANSRCGGTIVDASSNLSNSTGIHTLFMCYDSPEYKTCT